MGDIPQVEQQLQAAAKTILVMPMDGVEPPPAFSGLTKAANLVTAKNPREYQGTHRNSQKLLLFLRKKASDFLNLLRG
jgi:hypothetical protein